MNLGEISTQAYSTMKMRILLLAGLLFCLNQLAFADDDDFITGYNTTVFRTATDHIFSGTDVRRKLDRDRYTIYDYLTIQKLKLYESDDFRVWGAGSAWYRQELGESTFASDSKLDLSYGYIQVDRGRSADGFIKAGRIYNYKGLYHQRFDGAEIYYLFDSGIELDLYGGSRTYNYTEAGDDVWLTGGRAGYRFSHRNTIGFSWLLAGTDQQWDDQKIGGDWFFTAWDWLELSGYWGYDLIASEFYEINTSLRGKLSRDFDLRFAYDDIVPGLLIPKSSIFSVYSLAREQSLTSQFIYHPGEQWTFIADMKYIDYDNDGGQGNIFSDVNDLEGGYQWRMGAEIAFQTTPNDELTFRYEKMFEAEYGYTVTDLIRTNFDFRDYNIFDPPPEDEGWAFGRLENGFSSLSVTHWHRWSRQFTHSFKFYYYAYDHPLFLHQSGDDSFSTSLTLNYKPNREWNFSVGARYLDSLADNVNTQFYTRITRRF